MISFLSAKDRSKSLKFFERQILNFEVLRKTVHRGSK